MTVNTSVQPQVSVQPQTAPQQETKKEADIWSMFDQASQSQVIIFFYLFAAYYIKQF